MAVRQSSDTAVFKEYFLVILVRQFSDVFDAGHLRPTPENPLFTKYKTQRQEDIVARNSQIKRNETAKYVIKTFSTATKYTFQGQRSLTKPISVETV